MVTPKAVFQKSNKRWVWVALCRRTRQIVAYFIGDRSEKSCRALWERIPEAYKQCHTVSDFWDAYAKVFPDKTHQSVDKGSGEVAHVERWNNTLRQRLARFVRKTLLLTLRRQHVLFPSRKQCMNSCLGYSSTITFGSNLLPFRKGNSPVHQSISNHYQRGNANGVPPKVGSSAKFVLLGGADKA